MNFPHRSSWRSCAAAAVLAATATAASAAHGVRIDLCATAVTPAARVTLADIASIKGADDAMTVRLAALDVGQVSSDGQPTLVDRATLARWIQARTGLLSQDIAWAGAERCSVRLADAGLAHPLALAVASPALPARASQSGVTRGNVATLRSSSGGIRVESRVEVMQDGAVGQDVRVRLPGAAEAVLARVVAPGQVEVAQ